MLSHTVARRYAKGLLDAAAEIVPGSEQTVGNELSALVETIDGHPGLKLLVVNPSVPTEDKKAILGKISEIIGLGETLRRFIDVLAEKQRLDHLSLIDSVYAGLIDEHLGVVTAEITTATPLNPGQVAQLESSLRAISGVVRRRCLFGSGGSRRPPAAASVGQHEYQEPGLSGCSLCRRINWLQHGQHDSPGDSGSLQGTR